MCRSEAHDADRRDAGPEAHPASRAVARRSPESPERERERER